MMSLIKNSIFVAGIALVVCSPLTAAETDIRLMNSIVQHAHLVTQRAEARAACLNANMALETAKTVLKNLQDHVKACPEGSYLAVQLQPQVSAAAKRVADLTRAAKKIGYTVARNVNDAQYAFEKSLQGPTVLERAWDSFKSYIGYMASSLKPWINTPVGGAVTAAGSGFIVYKLWQWKKQRATPKTRPASPRSEDRGRSRSAHAGSRHNPTHEDRAAAIARPRARQQIQGPSLLERAWSTVRSSISSAAASLIPVQSSPSRVVQTEAEVRNAHDARRQDMAGRGLIRQPSQRSPERKRG